jgi:hypothetical protein
MTEPKAATAVADRENPPAGPEPGQKADTLQKQLREKDQLVAALTERLEQAAEQLDRMRRTGADKGHRSTGGSIPAELLQDQKQTLSELKKFVGNWDEIQPGETLARIESQVIEIRNLIASGSAVVTPASSPAASTAPATARERPATAGGAAAASSQSGSNAHSPAGKTSNSSWWEKQKAALLGEGHESAPEHEAAQAPPAGGATDSPPAQTNADTESDPSDRSAYPAADVVLPDLPPPVDFENLTLDDAKHAIRERDHVILQLHEPLLLLKAAAQLPANLQSRDNLPPAVRELIDELESQWQARFRQAELDLSLERARLAREQSQLRHQQEAVQKQLRTNGSAPREQPEAAEGEDSTSRRRWFRFMGKSDETRDTAPTDSN